MAVFPDKIILKNSTDSQAAIEAAIGPGGTDEITYGELVIGREAGVVKIYTIDSVGNVVSFGAATPGASSARFARFVFDADGSTNTPAAGVLNLWSNNEFAANQVDARGADFEASLLAGTGTPYNVTAYVNGDLAYTGTITYLANINSSRFTFQFADRSWLSNAPNGTIVDLYSVVFESATYTASFGDVKVYDGTDFEPQALYLGSLGDVAGEQYPTNGQLLSYDAVNSEWKPGNAVITDSTDFSFQNALLASYVYQTPSGGAPTAGKIENYTSTFWAFNVVDDNGVDREATLYANSSIINSDIYVNGVFQVSTTLYNWGNKNSGRVTCQITDQSWKTGLIAGDKIEFVDPFWTTDLTPAEDGQVLTWVDAESKWKPVDTASAVNAIDDLSDVDTSTTPPTNGQALAWDNASSQWKPATFAGGVTAIDDLSDVDTTTTPPTDGQALVWDNANSQWEPGTVSGGVTAIDDLSDVDTTTTPPTDGQALVWDNANSQWEPGTVSGGGGGNNYYSDNLWPADSNYANLSLGIHADGNFNDHSTNLFVPTVFGNTAINTNVSRFGSGSIEFDGSGDYVRYAFDTALDLNSASAFTIQCWIKPDTTAQRRIIASGGGTVAYNSTTGIHFLLQATGDGAANFQWWNGSANTGISGGTCPVGSWTHVAVTYDGTTVRLFVNGTIVNSSTDAIARPSTDPSLDLGTIPGENGSSTFNWNGYVDDIYIYKGVAVWTANFTPPASPLGTTSGGGLVSLDALSDVDTVTVAPTDGQVLTWDNANSQWEPATVSSSLDPLFSSVTVLASFDGETNGASTWTTVGSTSPTWTDNGATITNTITRWNGTTSLSVGAGAPSIPCSLGSSDFTIEAWVWLDLGTYSSFGGVFRNGVLADTFDVFYFGPNGSTTSARIRISNSSSTLAEATGNCVWQDEEWNHVAICRAGNTYSAYVNGDKVGSDVSGSSQTFNSGNLTISASGSSTGYVQDFRVTLGVARYSTQYYPVPTFPLPQT